MGDFLWWRDGVIYQIYPRSFLDTTGDGIGDLQGIIQKLDYLEDLGVDAIWLSPVYPSPDVDYGYDVSDYLGIDPKFGSMKDFEELVKKAHSKNLRIIMDLVLNHTSDQHPWFIESRKSKDNPYRDYYIWKEPSKNGKPPNNWLSMVGGSGWTYDKKTGEYYFHHFFKEQPDVNWHNPKLRAILLDVFRFWSEKGVDGFRLDIFSAYFKHKDLPDNPFKLFGIRPHDRMIHQYDMDQPEMIPLLQDIRGILNEYPERYAIGETFLDSHEKAAKYCGDDLLHAAFSFHDFLGNRWKARQFLKAIDSWEEVLKDKSWPNYVLNNHDVIRSATRYGKGEGDSRLKVAAAMMLTLRGTPFLYYGEEIGMREYRFKRSEILDPVGKHYWPFHRGRDGCRTPMQWDSSKNAGFSDGNPWLPVHTNHESRNVHAQTNDPKSLFSFYRELLKLRKKHPALVKGSYAPATSMPANTLIYYRSLEDDQCMVVLNFGSQRRNLDMKNLCARDCEILLSTHHKVGTHVENCEFWLEGDEAVIMQLKPILPVENS